MAHTSVYVSYNSNVLLPFGSVYYTKHGSIQTKDYPTEQLALKPIAMNILDSVLRNDVLWYKSIMIDKLIKKSDYGCLFTIPAVHFPISPFLQMHNCLVKASVMKEYPAFSLGIRCLFRILS